MQMVIFGLTVTSSWGNGHATLWRGLIRALARRGWSITFFERDTPYYAGTRDLDHLDGGNIVLYPDWEDIRRVAEQTIKRSDVVIVTSYCPDAVDASRLAQQAGRGLQVFYDLDTPVTLARIEQGERPSYFGPEGLADFDLVLSYTGGPAIDALKAVLGARHVVPLYGHVDPDQHRPATPRAEFKADLSYLGTYAPDRQAAVENLLVRPAARLPDQRFIIGGAQYPQEFPWSDNIFFVRHLPPADHPAFFSSSRLTLNVTREAMAQKGWCPSGRLFEAAACGVPIVTDTWPGLSSFFEPGSEILLAHDTDDVVAALALPAGELDAIKTRARQRVLDEHTSGRRAAELDQILNDAFQRSPGEPMMEAV
ncbi:MULTISPECIES: glycosyltransferase [unclassified Mesorhizobium]|uniref:CgeB family protein n=1 Tax=unclassified Mesorhizobium TaxID=325217 RepID=UPI000FCC5CA7|nr:MULTISPECIES: glycosyltransferase [unclassified Mesorhizobium]RUU84473.1 glycosyltransferase [Mesorhizobium sp. M7A.T.Ca.TU.009.01.1.2]TJV24811.1 MAG: glycosyltransferase [Mesorhizobium sp.]RUT84702.1 glycosyltransferase [Mesorhizobium sp. M7A.T.Ca.US.000.02.1.1]RUT91459.1 glycosyltransferase [Mesorhizobium sp. M7A.T.Ca.US.000.02.2.1]RUU03592.1 glycosyltransferase [Mesorhizobium sp. M7A.T.Ca.TU.009.02.1.1]